MASGHPRGYTPLVEIERCDPETSPARSSRREMSLAVPVASVFVLSAVFLALAQDSVPGLVAEEPADPAPIEQAAAVPTPERDAETLLAVERDTLVETPFVGSAPMIAGVESSLDETLAARVVVTPAPEPAAAPIQQYSATPDAQAAVAAVQAVAAQQAAQQLAQQQARAYGTQRRSFGKYDVFTGQRTSSRRADAR